MTYDINGFYDFLSKNPNFTGEEICERLKFLKKVHETKPKGIGIYGEKIIKELETYCYGIDWCFFLESINKGKTYRYGYDAIPFIYKTIKRHYFSDKNADKDKNLQSVYLSNLVMQIRNLEQHNFFAFGMDTFTQNCIVSLDRKGNIECLTFKEFIDEMFNCTIREEVKLLMEL